ncbi:right-handed parallel beta-helix repeat-containing protein [Aquisphaera giovannonii]|uniref:right-handed parallel beta-helix repeat-containing protein n=1 Tax=Aquisphaera giovannonii TaxID=406548 RepID=UPI0011E019D1|nr:right-handed parallel beta-helix repeat-containing protein [Aquisphaera giovannonii]
MAARATVLAWLGLSLVPAGAGRGEPPREPLVITRDAALEPGRVYGPIVVKGSGITVDGRGAWVVGATGGPAKAFRGTGIWAEHASRVTLRNLNAKGWETGLRIVDGEGWLVEGCDFSDNFDDPAFGWGENGRRGGIVLERVRKSTLRRNRANRVWDGCVLVDSDDNTLEHNDFSHTSNTGLRLWHASRNRVERNNLSYGLRIDPGEVHARDSACVLIESGSDGNRLVANDCTHGGDGIFIRVLNGRVSAGNVFEENDASYANNNGFEAWAPRNVYRRNRANHCSYGFWLGASDQTRLEGNEASFNGLPGGFHNSPHLPGDGHAGIVFLFGPSSHTVVRDNTCRDNNGAGVALVGDLERGGPKWKAFHWVVERNRLEGNRWGLYARNADWIDLSGNAFRGNTGDDVRLDGGVTRFANRKGDTGIQAPPVVRLEGPDRVRRGEEVTFDASRSSDPQGRPLTFAWDLGDGTRADSAVVRHAFAKPGFHRLGLTVSNGSLSEIGWRDLYVADEGEDLATEGRAASWIWRDPDSRVAFADDEATRVIGRSSVAARISPYGGGRVELVYPTAKDAAWPLRGRTELVFWLKALNENVPGWQDVNPVVRLSGSADRSVVFTPRADLLSHPPHNEGREGWTRFAIPLAGNADWSREGPMLETVHAIAIGFDSWGTPPLQIWIDGLCLE